MIFRALYSGSTNPRKFGRNFFAYLHAYYFKAHLMEAFNSLDSSKPYGRLLENPKTGCFLKLFLPENDFKNCSAISLPKQKARLWMPLNQTHDIQT